MSVPTIQRDKYVTFLTVAFGMFCVFLSILNLSEFANVALLNQTAGYPFGGEGTVPGYYASKTTYGCYNFALGFIYIGIASSLVWSLYKAKLKMVYWIMAIAAFILIVQVGMSSSQ